MKNSLKLYQQLLLIILLFLVVILNACQESGNKTAKRDIKREKNIDTTVYYKDFDLFSFEPIKPIKSDPKLLSQSFLKIEERTENRLILRIYLYNSAYNTFCDLLYTFYKRNNFWYRKSAYREDTGAKEVEFVESHQYSGKEYIIYYTLTKLIKNSKLIENKTRVKKIYKKDRAITEETIYLGYPLSPSEILDESILKKRKFDKHQVAVIKDSLEVIYWEEKSEDREGNIELSKEKYLFSEYNGIINEAKLGYYSIFWNNL